MIADVVRHHLEKIPATSKLWVAYSGGMDSHVLLFTLAYVLADLSRGRLQAIHINHHLQPQAEAWAAHCAQICQQLQVPLKIISVQVPQLTAIGLEAAAREARYRAFKKLLAPDDVLLMAHHRNDQAETLLLHLLRGSGVRGLAAMRAVTSLGAGVLWRPLLTVAHADLQRYALSEKLQWVNDPSNHDHALARNFLRHQVLPLLNQQWPAVDQVLARTAKHHAEAEGLLGELAEQDIAGLSGSRPASLSITQLLKLSSARRHNALRYWLRTRNLAIPEAKHLQQLDDTVLLAQPGAQPLLQWGPVQAKRYRDDLIITEVNKTTKIHPLVWDLKASLLLPNNLGTLQAERIKGSGFNLADPNQVSIRFRQGGERCQPVGRIGSHPLKKLLQEWGVPPWQRDQIPLVYQGEQLVSVVGYCVCQPYAAQATESGYMVRLILANDNIDTLSSIVSPSCLKCP